MGYLITPGAAGTHALADAAGLALKNGDPSFNPHCRSTDCVPADARVAYVYSNAFDTILSFWRRGFMDNPAHCRHLDGDVAEMLNCSDCTDLEPWLADWDSDPFGLRLHMGGWLLRPGTMFFKYELLEHGPLAAELGEFIGADLSGFRFQKRESDWTSEHSRTIGSLAQSYGDLMSAQYLLDGIVIT